MLMGNKHRKESQKIQEFRFVLSLFFSKIIFLEGTKIVWATFFQTDPKTKKTDVYAIRTVIVGFEFESFKKEIFEETKKSEL